MPMSLNVSSHHGKNPALQSNEDTLPKALGSCAGSAIGPLGHLGLSMGMVLGTRPEEGEG